MQPQPVRDRQAEPLGPDQRFHRRRLRPGRRDPEVLHLEGERPPGFDHHLLQGTAQPGLDGCGNGSLHQRGFAQGDLGALVRRQHIQGHLRTEDRAAQVHEDKHPILGIDRLDGLQHQARVRAKGLAGQSHAPGDGQLHILSRHAPG